MVTLDYDRQAAGDVDASGNLIITDVTEIQRFLAEMDVAYQINEPLSLYEKESSAALSALKNRLAQTKAAAGGKPVLICSYDTDDIHLSNSAYTYDNALAAMAFISAGDKDDAETILDAFVYVTEHDRYKPGRIRNAYAADTVYYYNGGDSVKLPGWWNASAGRWEEDQTQVGCNTGNTSYAALALLQYDKAYGSDKYLTTAKTLMDWVLDECSDSTDGFASGFERWPENGDVAVLKYKSTENNIDAYAAFKQLYAVTGELKYKDAADSALRFIKSMYDSDRGLFYIGTLENGNAITCTSCFETALISADGHTVDEVPYRKNAFMAQAPQGFLLDELLQAHDTIRKTNPKYDDIVDCCTMYKTLEKPVFMVPGNRGNIKITTIEDLYLLRGYIRYNEDKMIAEQSKMLVEKYEGKDKK